MNSALFGDKLRLMTSYTTFFGLRKEPFAAIAAGNDVFMAPQVATAMAGIKKAIAVDEAIITVSGPVGSGKTTIARRALEAAAEFHIIVTIGRIQFGHDEVLELLLAGLGVRQLPKSTVHRFATFRRVLQQYAEQKTRVFILIEDATRVGLDALSELEAVTAADAGVSNGANLILLGDESLRDFLRQAQLARIKQRIRARQEVKAQDASELQGYLKHCFRLAGKEFDEIFADGSAATVHRLTEGIPRVVNNLVTATLAAAAEQQLQKVAPDLIEKIANVEFGLTCGHQVAEIEAVIEKASAAPAAEAEPIPEPELVLLPEIEPATEVSTAAPDEALPDEDSIPELIQDTLPDLEILAPQLLPDEDSETEQAAAQDEPVHEATEFELPVLTGVFEQAEVASPAEPEPEAAPAAAAERPANAPETAQQASDDSGEVPAWERDPTLAQLKPDLDALERAMATAQGDDEEQPSPVAAEILAQETKIKAEAEAAAAAAEEIPEIVPEITLDREIQAKIEEATEALKQTQVDATAELNDDDTAAETGEPAKTESPKQKQEQTAEPEMAVKLPAAKAEKADQELEKIASELAKAKTLEDVDDMAAETLFGEEFSMMAAQVAANAPPIGDETQVAKGTLPGETGESPALSLAQDEAPTEAAATAPKPDADPMDTSSSQRLQALRDLKQVEPPAGAPPLPEASETIVMSGGGVELPPAENSDSVDSIEDQINTSMTQNLKALNINHLPRSDADDDDDDETVEKTGFFGLFKRR